MKVLVGAFNQEKALVGAFSVIVKTDCGTFGALHSTNNNSSSGTERGSIYNFQLVHFKDNTTWNLLDVGLLDMYSLYC